LIINYGYEALKFLNDRKTAFFILKGYDEESFSMINYQLPMINDQLTNEGLLNNT